MDRKNGKDAEGGRHEGEAWLSKEAKEKFRKDDEDRGKEGEAIVFQEGQGKLIAQLLDLIRNGTEKHETEEQSFPDCKWEDGGAPKKKKAKRKDDQDPDDKEEGKKKKLRRFVKKRSLSKNKYEISEECEEAETESKMRRKLNSEMAEDVSIEVIQL